MGSPAPRNLAQGFTALPTKPTTTLATFLSTLITYAGIPYNLIESRRFPRLISFQQSVIHSSNNIRLSVLQQCLPHISLSFANGCSNHHLWNGASISCGNC